VIRVVGLDLSLTSAGVARLQVDDQGAVSSWTTTCGRKGEAGETLKQRWYRLDSLATDIYNVVPLDCTLAVIEAPAMGAVGGHPHDRSGLWWLVVDRLMSKAGIEVATVAPMTLKVYGAGTGKATKPAMLAAAREHWGLHFDITNDDIADAVVLAAMGARWLGHPIDRLPHTHTRAIASAHWPTRKD
jgi:crossover junction endodeoxyribonuclease RuvC